MTKKKRNHPDVEEILSRPWCYYCERDFDDLKILINHQKAKHFKCERCGRRLNTAGGLSVHMSQVHKENLTAVDNALPNRAGLDIEIFGMEGIPEDIAQQHTQRVLTNYHQAQADRQGGGGGAPGSNASAPKKPKLESVSDLKKRLAEHKAAKLAGEKENGGSSGGTTPKPAASVATQAQPQAPLAASPGYSGYQQPTYAAPPTNGSYNQSPSYAQPPAVAASAPYQAPPAYAPAVSPPQMGGYGQAPTPQPGQPGYGQVPPVSYPPQPYPQPSQSPFQPHQPSMGYPPQPSFSPPPYQVPYSGQSYPGQAGMPPLPFGPGSSAPGFAQQMPNHRAHSPATNANFPAPVRTGSVSLPSAPGLPQRPAFGAPPVNAFQFQQLHQGQMPAPQAHALPPQYPPQQLPPSAAPQPPPQSNVSAPPHLGEFENASTLDDLIKNAQDKAAADNAPTNTTTTATHPAPTPSAAPALAKEEVGEEKGAKKDKEKEKPKSTRLVYSDNETSPEEKMAMMAKYAFTPAQKTIMV
ncbi:hypothetical protein LTR10_013701 [Elasticomyces elasticus]|uniref:C2H2-type domain-containing protein n=1 Tax=Exophiala sideris TaxID=1016849 RepID=A0ABR0JGM2_9EURO|nr:hypothetical protein LTR10_013701 [Elasticomyces elasticus]KAK5033324.1 hypothetical protein LTS07_003626 [Exophiala sideris]KAK5042179.1 hypothetical protein LTR13_001985 [Exophiala sideris]KAK5063868.1 hypothetical protein LTR69_003634 [Exophiala sideris]KAK5185447.1 hypothetical protein LTR44_002436 [Eurotiomycetes sp. CCFEE 6388]